MLIELPLSFAYLLKLLANLLLHICTNTAAAVLLSTSHLLKQLYLLGIEPLNSTIAILGRSKFLLEQLMGHMEVEGAIDLTTQFVVFESFSQVLGVNLLFILRLVDLQSFQRLI